MTTAEMVHEARLSYRSLMRDAELKQSRLYVYMASGTSGALFAMGLITQAEWQADQQREDALLRQLSHLPNELPVAEQKEPAK